MELTPLGFEGAGLASSPVWADERGNFREWFKTSDALEVTGIDFRVQQANISVSNHGVIRGIHYSLAVEGQAKWITCVTGSIIDVIVDIRPNSPTYGQHVSVELSSGKGNAVLIGTGLGHGFISLENDSAVSYLLSSTYSPQEEYEINPIDPDLKINWNLELVGGVGVILSPKDAGAPSLAERKAQGKLPQ
jgi:dTDP-4-dehydrorhamnose 3,5-epimerase